MLQDMASTEHLKSGFILEGSRIRTCTGSRSDAPRRPAQGGGVRFSLWSDLWSDLRRGARRNHSAHCPRRSGILSTRLLPALLRTRPAGSHSLRDWLLADRFQA